MKRLLAVALAAALPIFAQATFSPVQPVDFSAVATHPVQTGTLAARPSSCTVGQMYFASDAPAGQNLSQCTAANTWTIGGMSGAPGAWPAFAPVATSGSYPDLTNKPILTPAAIGADAAGAATAAQAAAQAASVPLSSKGQPGGVLGIDASGNVAVTQALLTKAGPVYNVRAWGAKGDEKQVKDASITAGSYTLISATAGFTTADTGKTMTVNAGSRGISVIKYVSGGSITGTAGQTCTFSAFDGGGSGLTGQMALTGINVIAAATIMVETNMGSGYTANATTATLSNGTATCSGTASIGTWGFYSRAITGTITYVNTTTVTLSVAAVSTVSNAKAVWGTDDSAPVIAAIQAAYDDAGGVIYFPRGNYLILSQLSIPNNGLTTPSQPPLTLTGDGGFWDGSWECRGGVNPGGCKSYAVAASRLDMRFVGSPAKIDTRGLGRMDINKLSLEDNGEDATPFVQTTNTVLVFRDNSCIGSGPGTSLSWQDCLIYGGTGTLADGSATAPNQGYGGIIEHNYFSRIQRGVYGRTYFNSMNIINNVWSNTCGGLTPMEIDGTGDFSTKNYWAGNLFELSGYVYGPTFTNAQYNVGIGNSEWDESILFLGGIRLSGATSRTNGICMGCALSPPWASALGASPIVDQTSPGGSSFVYSYGPALGGTGAFTNNPSKGTIFAATANTQTPVTWSTVGALLAGTLYGDAIYGGMVRLYGIDGTTEKTRIGSQQGSWIGTALGINKPVSSALYSTFQVAGTIQTEAVAFFNLPACDANHEGAMRGVTDSTTGTWGAVIVGYSTNHVLAYCNGTAWTVH